MNQQAFTTDSNLL